MSGLAVFGLAVACLLLLTLVVLTIRGERVERKRNHPLP
jgi:hypothetical protein